MVQNPALLSGGLPGGVARRSGDYLDLANIEYDDERDEDDGVG